MSETMTKNDQAKEYILNIVNRLTFEQRKAMRNEQWYTKHFKQWHSQNNQHRWQRNIGSLMSMIGQAHHQHGGLTLSFDEWVDYYVSEQNDWENMLYKMKALKEDFGMTYTEAVLYWWSHVLDFCYEGYSYEQRAIEYFKNAFPDDKFEEPTPDQDKAYGVDLFHYDAFGNLIAAYQVKGWKYFIGKNALGTMHKHAVGYKAFKESYGIDLSYLVKEDLDKVDHKNGEMIKTYPVYCNQPYELFPDYSDIAIRHAGTDRWVVRK